MVREEQGRKRGEGLGLKGKERRVEIFRRLSEIIDPRSELEFSSVFELLIAVMLSAQATDKQVNKVTRVLFTKAKTAESIYGLGVKGLEEQIRSIGLFRSKARNIVKTCAILLEKYGGEVPSKRVSLEGLPGVGRKTAGVVLNVGFHKATIPVDTHVFRLSQRLGLTRAKTPEKAEAALNRAVPKDYRRAAHHLLILHGRYVCKARRPLCGECVIADLCRSKEKMTPEKGS